MALLLAGTLSLGVGAVLGLQDDDDRSVVAQDLGAVPGSPATVAMTTSGPVADDIPVLSGPDDPDRSAGPVPGGFEAAPAPATGSAGASAAPPRTPSPPTTPGSPAPGTSAPSVEPGPELADPTPTYDPPRPSPQPMPRPEPSLAPQVPWLVSPLYRVPDPPPSSTRTPVVPAQLDLPARSVTAPVDPVGTDPSGGMVVPEQVRTVGWWAPGVLPGGSVGSAVIAGHVDSRAQGVGVLSVLPQLTQGEPVLVRDATGRTATFRVAARREYGKYDLPRDVFRRDGAPQLVLITCGGRFDPAARSYESNIVVYAVPA
ncbi:class F sortase [Pseudonocardia endophytica]|uniref:Sortase family protein n=1 Tax=Pseudonocardia endophytica TaxID=401976 RepID=A0A4R1HZ20_PSEEN|nr:class F sortase [Pseudonocardia endophytica]TCK26435.1 sortase family protein [Pseudonocardia endophytica]